MQIFPHLKTNGNSVFILFGRKTVWEVGRFLVALYRVDEIVVPIPQTKQTRSRCTPYEQKDWQIFDFMEIYQEINF